MYHTDGYPIIQYTTLSAIALKNSTPVPILDENKQVHSYTELKIEKLYIALNKEMYIILHTQELKMCKKIAYEYHCEELF